MILEKLYDKTLTNTGYIPRNPSEIPSNIELLTCDKLLKILNDYKNLDIKKYEFKLYFTDYNIREKYEFMENVPSRKINEMFEYTSNFKLKTNRYIIKYFKDINDRRCLNKFFNFDEFYSVFNIKSNSINNNTSKRIHNRQYEIDFNTLLGCLYLNNIKSLNIDWVNVNTYKLSDKAQLFYRFFILPTFIKKCDLMRIDVANICNRLGIDFNKNSVLKILDELKCFKFIKEYKDLKKRILNIEL